MTTPKRPRPATAALMLALSALAGCAGGGAEGGQYAPSPARARELVRAALDAWKSRATADLERRSPPSDSSTPIS